MIVIRQIPEPVTQLYCSANELIGDIHTQLELNDVRLQIRAQQKEGYYIMYKGKKIAIGKDGEITHWPAGFYDKATKQLNELFGI